MKWFLNANKGSLTIEASLSLSIFLFAFVTLLSFVNVARIESRVQYAINQSAKELSQYLYAADQVLALEAAGATDEEIKMVVDHLIDFNYSIGSGYPQQSEAMDIKTHSDEFNKPAEVIEWLATMALNDPSSITSQAVAVSLADMLVPKYLYPGSSMGEIDQQLKALHVRGGLSGLDFKNSSILEDGETINIVVDYRIGSMFPSFFNKDIVVRQSASTAAWVKKDPKIVSKWQLSSLERGQAFLAEIRTENPEYAVKPGQGIDLYNNGICTSVFTLNLFTPSYSNSDGAGNYTLNTSRIMATLRSYSEQSLQQSEGIGSNLEMLDGRVLNTADQLSSVVLMIVPEEAQAFQTELEAIATEVELEKGISIEWQFREPALL